MVEKVDYFFPQGFTSAAILLEKENRSESNWERQFSAFSFFVTRLLENSRWSSFFVGKLLKHRLHRGWTGFSDR